MPLDLSLKSSVKANRRGRYKTERSCFFEENSNVNVQKPYGFAFARAQSAHRQSQREQSLTHPDQAQLQSTGSRIGRSGSPRETPVLEQIESVESSVSVFVKILKNLR